MQVYFVNTVDPPLRSKHICYFTRGDGVEFELCEVVEEYFPHPDAPDDAVVQCINIYNRDKQRIPSLKSGPLVQSCASENTLRLLYPVTHLGNSGSCEIIESLSPTTQKILNAAISTDGESMHPPYEAITSAALREMVYQFKVQYEIEEGVEVDWFIDPDDILRICDELEGK